MDYFRDMIEDITRQLADRGDVKGTRPDKPAHPPAKNPEKSPASAREVRSVMQIINFNSPSFPA